MYSVADYGQTTAMGINESKLVDVTTNDLQEDDVDTSATILDQLYSNPALTVPLTDSANDDLKYGWFISMEGEHRGVSTTLGEKVLAPATIFNGQVFFSTYQLHYGAQADCEAGNLGISRLYHLDYRTGEAVYDYDNSNNSTQTDNERGLTADGKVLARSDRVRTLGEGIPSGIVPVIDASGRVTMLISSSDKVEATNVTEMKLISPVYWMQW
jgi:type IV pilus assembly protein PilY1